MSYPEARIRLFVNDALSASAQVTLQAEQTHYLTRVMRQKSGDGVLVFNGTDGEWLASIDSVAKKSCQLTLERQTRPQRNEPDVWLCFAPVKNAPLQYIAQKATELGVSALQPVYTQHTIVRRVNTERLQANCIEAAEQSERLTVPAVHEPVTLDTLLAQWNSNRTLIMCDESGNGKPAKQALANLGTGACAILIGPEGGFSQNEFAILSKHSYVIAMGMGPRILRADTAALAALVCYQSMLGDWDDPPRFRSAT